MFKMTSEKEEKWAQLPGFSRYFVSSKGRVLTLKGKFLKLTPGPAGYIIVKLIADTGIRMGKRVHILTATAFIPNPEEKPFVDHINRIRSDNNVDNLRWATIEENGNNKNKAQAFKGRAVNQYEKNGTLRKRWPSVASIHREMKVSKEAITEACKTGVLLRGCYWEYVDTIPIPGEEWRQIKVDEHIIEASSVGRIKLLTGTLTYGHKQNHGYLAVHIGEITMVVHKIICQAFHPIPDPEKYEVNHIDSNRSNNNALNLEWLDHSANVSHGIEMKGTAKSLKPVHQYNLDGTFVKRFDTLKDASRAMKCEKVSNMIKTCEGRQKTCMGYKWKYADEDTNISKELTVRISKKVNT